MITIQQLAHCNKLLAQWILILAECSNLVTVKKNKTENKNPEFICKNVDIFGLIDRTNHQDTSSAPWMILTCRAEKSHILIDVNLLESSVIYGKIA